MECPNCALVNPETAQRCDCGYDFQSRTVSGLASKSATQSINVGAIGWYLAAMKKYAVFTGRAPRREFWYFFLFQNLIVIALMTLSVLVGIADGPSPFRVLAAMYAIATVIPALAVSARRLHDTGRTAWWIFIGLVPLVGPIILLVFYAEDSKPGANQYGPSPKAEPVPSTLKLASAADVAVGAYSTLAAEPGPAPQTSSTAAPSRVESHESISPQVQAEGPTNAPMIFCTKCGAKNPAVAKYCHSCGNLMFKPHQAGAGDGKLTGPVDPPKNGANSPEGQTDIRGEASPATEGPSNKLVATIFLTVLAMVAFLIVFALHNSGSPSGVPSTESQTSNADFSKKLGALTGSSSTATQGNPFDPGTLKSSSVSSSAGLPVHSPICPSGVSSDNPMIPVPKGKISLTNAALDVGALSYGSFPLNFRVSNQTSYCIAIIEIRAVLQVEAPKPSVSLKLKTTLSQLLKPGSEEDAMVMIDAYKDQNGNAINDPYIEAGLQKLDVIGVWGFRPVGRQAR